MKFQPSQYSDPDYGGVSDWASSALSVMTLGVSDKVKPYIVGSEPEPATATDADAHAPLQVAPPTSPTFHPPAATLPKTTPPEEQGSIFQSTWFVPTLILVTSGLIAGGIWYTGRK